MQGRTTRGDYIIRETGIWLEAGWRSDGYGFEKTLSGKLFRYEAGVYASPCSKLVRVKLVRWAAETLASCGFVRAAIGGVADVVFAKARERSRDVLPR
jgi:hypothetical protein